MCFKIRGKSGHVAQSFLYRRGLQHGPVRRRIGVGNGVLFQQISMLFEQTGILRHLAQQCLKWQVAGGAVGHQHPFFLGGGRRGIQWRQQFPVEVGSQEGITFGQAVGHEHGRADVFVHALSECRCFLLKISTFAKRQTLELFRGDDKNKPQTVGVKVLDEGLLRPEQPLLQLGYIRRSTAVGIAQPQMGSPFIVTGPMPPLLSEFGQLEVCPVLLSRVGAQEPFFFQTMYICMNPAQALPQRIGQRRTFAQPLPLRNFRPLQAFVGFGQLESTEQKALIIMLLIQLKKRLHRHSNGGQHAGVSHLPGPRIV